ncbi:MAG: DUF58 domain-containing protein [Candidatus Thermoplasmatota archaeon]
MGLGKPTGALLWLGGGLAAAAVAGGNLVLLGLALLPLGLAVASALGPHASIRSATIEQRPERAVVGQDVEIRVRLRVAGRGPLQVNVKLPDSYRVVRGRNVLHTWVSGRRDEVMTFTAACDKRGVHELGPIEAEAPSAWLLGGPRPIAVDTRLEVRVEPPVSRLRRWPETRTRARRGLADFDLTPSGLVTTNFQDIRQYVRGDPHRSINWKASARRTSGTDDLRLLVNDYEREGRRQVWVFLDARPDLVGTSLDNALERRIEAALAIANIHIKRGFGVGFTLYNQDLQGTPYADASGRQSRRILELVAALPHPVASSPASLAEAVLGVRGRLHRARTVAYVVTTLQGGEEEGLRHLRRLLARRRGPLPIAVIHIDPSGLLPDAQRNDLGRTLAILQRPHLEAVRRLGVRAVRWDPGRHRLPNLIRRLGM